ncbi:hypothetical protein B7R54_01005 [Subtercola boreus]|uniref:Cellulose synthase n=1 Tax=Subtercola boreus TaxID=120213 RepID=A0A3E0VEQ9_9MICO|nr:hypothetical protein [Subtercola boreus]RFA07948.1 hypothetical protein B7R54_01005 [Subtercola boreus]TQL55188.1 hypothetical protein FB464_2746 [Subtercola boreus]
MRPFSSPFAHLLASAGIAAILVTVFASSASAASIGTVVQAVDASGQTVTAGIDELPDDSAPVFVTVKVPAGLSPTQATTLIEPVVAASDGVAGSVRVIVKGQVRQVVDPTAPATVSVPLSAADVADGQVAIGFEYVAAGAGSDSVCVAPDSAVVSVGDVSLGFEGQPELPTSLADFFSPALDAISVTIPDGPSDALRQAGLAAVGSLAHAYPSPVALSLSTASDAADAVDVEPARGRVVAFAVSGDTVTTALSTDAAGVPTLTVSGPEADLAAAGAALGSDYLALADTAETSGLTQSGTTTVGLTQTLQDLGAGAQIALARYGQADAVVNVSQSSFGGPIGDATVHLVGTHSDIPDSVVATMNVYWNDYLIGSAVLGHTPAFDVTLPVAASRLTASNALKVTLSAAPATGECLPESRSIPIELFVDNAGSSVAATRGQSLDTGFQRFPQVLGTTLPVAFGTGMTDASSVAAAGDVVASLQRNSRVQLDLTVLPAGEFVSSDRSGLIVGATSDDSDALKAPLRLDAFRSIDSKAVVFGVGATLPYAALEAFETEGRNVLLLGGWAPDGSDPAATDQLQRQAANYSLSNAGAWFGLNGDVVVAQPGGDVPVQLSSNAIVPQAAVTSDYNGYALWTVVVAAILILAAVVGELTRRRRRAKLKRYVDAQLAADRDSGVAR